MKFTNSKEKININNKIIGKLKGDSIVLLDSIYLKSSYCFLRNNPNANITVVEKDKYVVKNMLKNNNCNINIINGLFSENIKFANIYYLDYMCTIVGNADINPINDIEKIFNINPAASIYLTICIRANCK